jgi:hypothetical protein
MFALFSICTIAYHRLWSSPAEATSELDPASTAQALALAHKVHDAARAWEAEHGEDKYHAAAEAHFKPEQLSKAALDAVAAAPESIRLAAYTALLTNCAR